MIDMDEADKVLIRYADSESPAAISFRLKGELSPSQVRARIVSLTEATDWLSSAQEDRLLTLKMKQIINELMGHTLTARNAEVLLNGLEKVGNRLDRRTAATEQDLMRLYAFQGAALLDTVNEAMAIVRAQIAVGNIPTTELEWDALLETAIRASKFKIAELESV